MYIYLKNNIYITITQIELIVVLKNAVLQHYFLILSG